MRMSDEYGEVKDIEDKINLYSNLTMNLLMQGLKMH